LQKADAFTGMGHNYEYYYIFQNQSYLKQKAVLNEMNDKEAFRLLLFACVFLLAQDMEAPFITQHVNA
jgi:hypothetical protein